MGVKTAGVGHFTIPTAPAAGTSVTSGAANTFTTTPVQLIASAAAALYITGVHLEAAAAKAATYIIVQLMIGASGSETIVGQYLVPLSTASTVALGYRQIYPFIPVAAGVRISAKTADSVGSAATLVTLECIAQSNVVDDAIPVTTVTTVTNLTNAPTAGDLTATMKASVTTAATAATPTAAAVTGAVGSVTGNVGGSVASVTGAVGSVTGAVGSVTAAVTLPAIPANWITAAGITAAALNGKGDWNIGKTGYSLTQGFPANFAAMSLTVGGLVTLAAVTHTGAVIPTVSAVTGLTASNLDATVSSRSTYAGGAVASVTGNVGGSVASVVADVGITQAGADKVWGSAARTLTSFGTLVPDIATAVWASLTSGMATVGSIGKKLADWTIGTAQTGDSFARLGAPAGASISADVAAVKSDSAAVKAQTDQLAFTVAGQVDANLKSVKGAALLGTGTAIDPWHP